MVERRISEAQLAEIKQRHPVDHVAAQFVALRRKGRGFIGPCPGCSADKQSKRATRFWCDADGWKCATGCKGGDVIKLVQIATGRDFLGAIDWLGGARDVDPAAAARLEADAKATAAKREAESEKYREGARKEAFEIWKDRKPIAGSAAAAYLAQRHIAELPPGPLGFLPQLAYWETVGDPGRLEVLRQGPAMVAPIVTAAGKFAAVHMTWLDRRGDDWRKVAIRHPDSGEELPAKKVRGRKAGNRIELVPCAEPHTLIVGEGIETTLSVWRAMQLEGRSLAGVAFWAAVDLGNLAGAALASVTHPSKRSDKNRPIKVPGPIADLESAAIEIPASVTRLVLLGDGDSDPFTTQCAIARAGVRHAAPGRNVVAAWAPAGSDFNDLAPDWSRILAIVEAAEPPAQPAISSAEETDAAPPKRRVRKSSPETRGDSSPADQADPDADHNHSFSDQPPAPPGDENSGENATLDDDRIAESVIIEAAALDHSDTDNAVRLKMYFGRDLSVMAQSGVPGWGGQYLAWTGAYWDLDGGMSGATRIAQRVGDLIKAEADVMAATKAEQRAIDAGAAARAELQRLDAGEASADGNRRAELQDKLEAGMTAMGVLGQRKGGRRKHGVASKNAGKVDSMLRLLSHHLRRLPEDYNADPMLIATRGHTLRFWRAAGVEGKSTADVEVEPGHDRAHLLTSVVPVDYDPAASCPGWLKNLERFQPDPDQRRSVQQFTGCGLLGVPIQRVMYHYGTGGNFKSVFLEVVTRVIGDGMAIGLPAESISGKDERKAGQASPDLERIFGKRMLRVLELPDGVPLQASTVKKLTGGERWPIRTLYKGYYELKPTAKPHMSGNSLPTFDGADGGMKRRLLLVEWPIALALAEQRDFDVVCSELVAEAPGILNWLIEGALDYLRNGLYVAPSIAALTKDQIEEMDPIGQFDRECVMPDETEGAGVEARKTYRAYRAWSEANAKRTRSETKFGRDFKKLHRRDDSGRLHRYVGIKLVNVPAADDDRRPDMPPGDYGPARDDEVI